MLGVAVGHVRYTHEIMSHACDFVFNVPSCDQVHVVDICGSVSGRGLDKFDVAGITPMPSVRITSPGIAEFPVNIECAIRHAVDLGSHTFYFGEIVTVRCGRAVLTSKGTIDSVKLAPMTAFQKSYWSVGEALLGFHTTQSEAIK